jgi:hypothetical protein
MSASRIILSPLSYTRLLSAPAEPSDDEASAEYRAVKAARNGQLFHLTESGREEPVSLDALFQAWRKPGRASDRTS